MENKIAKFYVMIALLCTLCYALSIHISENRMALYFSSIYVILFPQTIYTLTDNQKLRKILTVACYGMLIFIVMVMNLLPSSFLIANYKPI